MISRALLGITAGTVSGIVFVNSVFVLGWISVHTGLGGVYHSPLFSLTHHPSLGHPTHISIHPVPIFLFLAGMGGVGCVLGLTFGKIRATARDRTRSR